MASNSVASGDAGASWPVPIPRRGQCLLFIPPQPSSTGATMSARVALRHSVHASRRTPAALRGSSAAVYVLTAWRG